MTRLHHILAIEASARREAEAAISTAAATMGKPALLSGLSRTYQPSEEGGARLPAESVPVQVEAEDVLAEMMGPLARLLNVTAARDYANCVARASILVDGKPLVEDVPATYLLWLEKTLVQLESFVRHLPQLAADETWHRDEAQGLWATKAVETLRTKKVPTAFVRAAATPQHPAQVDLIMEDVPEGTWTLVKYSGALPAPRVRELLARVRTLLEAVKTARAEANMQVVADQDIGTKLLEHLFA